MSSIRNLFFYVRLNSRKILRGSKFRNFYTSNIRYFVKEWDVSISELFEDVRLQKHLKVLREQFSIFQEQNKAAQKENIQQIEVQRNVVNLMKDVDKLNFELKELGTLIKELMDKKDELLNTALSEKDIIENNLTELKKEVLQFLIPNEIVDDKDIILELAPGVGGQEAMLFAKDMFDLYNRYAQWKNWSFEILKFDTTDLGGLRSAHIAISGHNAFKVLKYECGVHRIQRVPKTERHGRIHTSTMTVAVLPQPSDIDIVILPKDIELEFKRSSAPGGQHVNKTDSCVRIIHKATGIAVECQMERDQHKNKAIALKSLRAKLYEKELENAIQQTKSSRKVQVGSAARSEKVRTYNYAQDRITDHRAYISIFNIEEYFRGGECFDELLRKLETWNHIQSLYEILQKYDMNKK